MLVEEKMNLRDSLRIFNSVQLIFFDGTNKGLIRQRITIILFIYTSYEVKIYIFMDKCMFVTR